MSRCPFLLHTLNSQSGDDEVARDDIHEVYYWSDAADMPDLAQLCSLVAGKHCCTTQSAVMHTILVSYSAFAKSSRLRDGVVRNRRM